MLHQGITNPAILELLACTRHTNTFVICDIGFPFFPDIPTIDLSLCPGIPSVLQVFNAIRQQYGIGSVFMAEEFMSHNDDQTVKEFTHSIGKIAWVLEPHTILKQRLPEALGIIRTGDTTRYANMVLLSADNNTE